MWFKLMLLILRREVEMVVPLKRMRKAGELWPIVFYNAARFVISDK